MTLQWQHRTCCFWECMAVYGGNILDPDQQCSGNSKQQESQIKEVKSELVTHAHGGQELERKNKLDDVQCLLLTTGKAKSDIWARPCSHPTWPVCIRLLRGLKTWRFPHTNLCCLICLCFPGDIHWFRRLYGSLPVVFDPFVVLVAPKARLGGAPWWARAAAANVVWRLRRYIGLLEPDRGQGLTLTMVCPRKHARQR